MRSLIRNPRDFWAGALFLGFGVAFVVLGRDLRMGTARSMGPAFFPVVLGGLLALIGAISIMRGLARPSVGIRGFAWKEGALILGATVLFGVLLRGLGLAVSLVVTVMVSGLASMHFRWPRYVLLGVGLAAFCSLVFIKGLSLPMPLLGRWFPG